MNDINLVDLKEVDFNLATVFVALWQERSVTRAAARLGLSQAAVSAALARLRETCGDELFVRSKGGMTPSTRAGRMAEDLQTHLLGLRRSFQLESAFVPRQVKRGFTVGMSDDFELALGPALVERLHRRAPGVSVIFRQTNRHLIETMLGARDLDLAVVANPPARAWYTQERIGSSGYACLLDAKRHGVKLPLTLEDYLRLPHVLVSYSGRTGVVDAALRRIGRERTVKASLTHFSSLPAFLGRLEALATLPAHAAQALARGAKLQVSPVPVRLEPFEVVLVQRRDSLGDAGVAWLREQVRACAGAILKGPPA